MKKNCDAANQFWFHFNFDTFPKVGQIQESIDLLNRKLNEAEMSHQVKENIFLIWNKWDADVKLN